MNEADIQMAISEMRTTDEFVGNPVKDTKTYRAKVIDKLEREEANKRDAIKHDQMKAEKQAQKNREIEASRKARKAELDQQRVARRYDSEGGILPIVAGSILLGLAVLMSIGEVFSLLPLQRRFKADNAIAATANAAERIADQPHTFPIVLAIAGSALLVLGAVKRYAGANSPR